MIDEHMHCRAELLTLSKALVESKRALMAYREWFERRWEPEIPDSSEAMHLADRILGDLSEGTKQQLDEICQLEAERVTLDYELKRIVWATAVDDPQRLRAGAAEALEKLRENRDAEIKRSRKAAHR